MSYPNLEKHNYEHDVMLFTDDEALTTRQQTGIELFVNKHKDDWPTVQ
jgi:cytochrome c peroxidase